MHIFQTVEQVGHGVAELVAGLSRSAVTERRLFTVAISGGSLPKIIGPELAAGAIRTQIDWPAWQVFFADERCVPLDDPESNFRLAREQLFERVPIPSSQIHPINDSLPAAAAAEAYELVLQELFGPDLWPRFDLILLGMGPDGHIASLFPDHALLSEHKRWVAAIANSPKPPPSRITLTLPVLNNARSVVFVVTGSGKAEILPRVLKADSKYPAGMVSPVEGQVHWFLDQGAASHLAWD
jgi:6-phosphogluconolactonase